MTTTEPETTPTNWPAPVLESPPPFSDGASFELTRPVELEQLTDEITKATGRQVTLAVSGPGQYNEAISANNPATLAITPGSVAREKVEQVIEAHAPVAGYAVPDSEKRYAAVVQKIVDDPNSELTPDEVQVALRGLLVRSLGPSVG